MTEFGTTENADLLYLHSNASDTWQESNNVKLEQVWVDQNINCTKKWAAAGVEMVDPTVDGTLRGIYVQLVVLVLDLQERDLAWPQLKELT